jgi:hypothetical protein
MEGISEIINEIAENSKNKNTTDKYRVINEFNKEYQLKNHSVKD